MEDTGATPNLMAAFRQGFDLAQAQAQAETEQGPGATPGREVGARPDGA